MTDDYPRESKFNIGADFLKRGRVLSPVSLESIDYAITALRDERPTAWTTAVIVDGDSVTPVGPGTPFDYSGLPEAKYPYPRRLWARLHSGSQAPVIDCGEFRVT